MHCDAIVISDVILWRVKLVIALSIKIVDEIPLHFTQVVQTPSTLLLHLPYPTPLTGGM